MSPKEKKSGLLFVTQVVDRNDPVLGFVVGWINGFIEQGIRVIVFARKVSSDHGLSSPVIDLGQPLLRRILRLWSASIRRRHEYGSVLIHMTPEILVIGWPVWKLLGKRTYLWYTHGSVSRWLKIAVRLCDKVFTASDLSLRLETKKKTVVGHGIDTEEFKPSDRPRQLVVLWVSRVQPRKHLEDSLRFLAGFKRTYPETPWTLRVIGSSAGHEDYLAAIQAEADKLGILDQVRFEGPMRHDQLPQVFAQAAAFISTSQTGSLDKVVLESLACGTPVIASGQEYQGLKGVTDMRDPGQACAILQSQLSRPVTDEDARVGLIAGHSLKRLMAVLAEEMDLS